MCILAKISGKHQNGQKKSFFLENDTFLLFLTNIS